MKLIFCLVVALFTFAAETKAATLFHYEGNAFTDISVPGCCGTRIVADVLFKFDATGVSGTFSPLDGSILYLSFGVVNTLAPQPAPHFSSLPAPVPPSVCFSLAGCQLNFTLSSGLIVGWNLSTVDPFSDEIWGVVSYSQGSQAVDANVLHNPACLPGRPCGGGPIAINYNLPGSWTIAPVPGPIAGAGMPGFLIAVLAFIGWRRKRLSHQ